MKIVNKLSRIVAEALRLGPAIGIDRRENHRKSTFKKSFDGPYLLDTPGDRTFEFCMKGYGPFIADTIAAYEQPFLFLDIGANLGLFSLLAARHPLCLKVLAFEPLPAIFNNLTSNVQYNRAAKVSAHCYAIDDSDSDVELRFNPEHSGMSKLVASGMAGAVRAKPLGAERLTELVGKSPTAILAKIDVEGSELSVMSILRQTKFYPRLDAIIIEISERNLAPKVKSDLLDLLAEDGFVETSRNGPSEHYDAFYRRLRSNT